MTKQVIKTLKYEWLQRIPVIKEFDHLTSFVYRFRELVQRTEARKDCRAGFYQRKLQTQAG